ncbi:hypothetical protein ACHAC9_18775 [Massilia sp. CMS3.1]|uniref:hypothetical protein n=1 Tax=Massilia sp. CMS3.1 TaxID=3373083 RepID=UPI003EE69BC3
MAHIGHDAIPDTCSLTYLHDWLEAPDAYPLSPTLPLTHASAATIHIRSSALSNTCCLKGMRSMSPLRPMG